ncbi:phytoene desaturase family protein [Spirochaeta africana]|uniref:Phytoene desaturase n=1 Tax=Spirochaeta africana (strain ATCC 700263 / DSM 8902 / Z-7692) TaxID=889378 RepID=H9UJM7_SPIAZ|nr:phytoene desaturase family protein [Spirochaeta africana]AFG37720.1 phytoene desaturase [Spirochaeta africana DSM 8902]
MSKKVCVIGGGFGGLSAAALLAHKGFDVTLLEKNPGVGGRAQVWRQDGFVFDMGPSWYLMPEVFDQFFEYLGKNRADYYKLQQLDPYYRIFFSPDEIIDINRDLDRTKEIFDRFEPGGGERLQRYLDGARYKYDIAMREFLYTEYRSMFQFFNRRILVEGTRMNIFQSLDRYVGKYFSDRRAKQILEYAMVFLGASPRNAPALYSIMSHVDLNLGVYFPIGGMAALVDGFRQLAEDMGVRILTDHEVTGLKVENGQITAAKTAHGEVNADIFLSNADYQHTDQKLLPPEYRSYSSRYWDKRTMAPTMFIIYLGLNRKVPELVHHNLYFSDPWDEHFEQIFSRPQWPDNPSYYVSCASFDDDLVAPAGKENIFFLVPLAAGLEDTDQIREQYAEKILDHFENLIGTRIRDAIEIRRLFSHRDFQSEYNAYKGTALGIAHTLNQTAIFRPSHRSKKVKNLFYSGQYTHPGVGVPMTVISSQVIGSNIAESCR